MLRKVTLKDVAKEAGVSVFTVSGALNENHRVKESTRKRVVRIAKEMGYERDAAAAALCGRRKNKSNTKNYINVGIVEKAGIFGEDVLVGMRKRGYQAVFLDFPSLADLRKTLDVWWNQGVWGLIINLEGCCNQTKYLESALAEGITFSRFSMVTLGLSSFHSVHDTAGLYFRKCLLNVIDKGYRRLAVLLTKTDHMGDDDARLGALMVLKERYASTVDICWREITPSSDGLSDGATDWLRTCQPDAVILFPGGAWSILEDAGFKFPRDFAFCGALVPKGGRPSIAGIVNSLDDHLGVGFDMMDEQLRLGEKGLPKWPVTRGSILNFHEGSSLPRACPRKGRFPDCNPP